MSQLFTWGGQSIGASASASVLPMNTQDWSPLGWTGWISLQSKGLSRVFSNTTVQKHRFFPIRLVFRNSWGFLVVQWWRLHTFPAGGTGVIPGWGTKIPQAEYQGQKEKKTAILIYVHGDTCSNVSVHFSSGEKSKCPSSSIPVLFEHNQNSVAYGNSGWKRHTMTLNSGSMPSCEVSGKQPRDAQINMYHDIEKSIRPWRHYLWFIMECY